MDAESLRYLQIFQDENPRKVLPLTSIGQIGQELVISLYQSQISGVPAG